MTYARRRFLWTVGFGIAGATSAGASTASAVTRELRRMVGFHIVAADDVRQVFRMGNARIFQLRESGLFRERPAGAGTFAPAFSDVIVFAKPLTPDVRPRVPGVAARASFGYRLLIDGEFYDVEAFD